MADRDGNAQFSRKEVENVARILGVDAPELNTPKAAWTTEQLVQFVREHAEKTENPEHE